jgi:hypothetical protein
MRQTRARGPEKTPGRALSFVIDGKDKTRCDDVGALSGSSAPLWSLSSAFFRFSRCRRLLVHSVFAYSVLYISGDLHRMQNHRMQIARWLGLLASDAFSKRLPLHPASRAAVVNRRIRAAVEASFR